MFKSPVTRLRSSVLWLLALYWYTTDFGITGLIPHSLQLQAQIM